MTEQVLYSAIASIRTGTRKRKNFDPCTRLRLWLCLRQGSFNSEIRITYHSRRSGPRDQTLQWEQTEEEAGNASHLSTRDMPAARPQCRFSLHLKFTRACKTQLSNFTFNTWNHGATHNGYSTDEGHSPETSGHLLIFWHFHKHSSLLLIAL